MSSIGGLGGLGFPQLSGLDSFLPAALHAARTSGDPLLDGRITSLLRAVGGPSMLVRGTKTRLGGRLGSLLKAIGGPSMAARLARAKVGNGQGAPLAVSHPGRVGEPSQAQLLRGHKTVHNGRSIRRVKVASPDRLQALQLHARLRRLNGVDMAGVRGGSPSSAVESGGKLVGEVPGVDGSFAGPPLGWPWDKPAPIPPATPPPPPPTSPYQQITAAGSVVDLFA